MGKLEASSCDSVSIFLALALVQSPLGLCFNDLDRSGELKSVEVLFT